MTLLERLEKVEQLRRGALETYLTGAGREDAIKAAEDLNREADRLLPRPVLEAFLRQVLELHYRNLGFCWECERYWPCPTVRYAEEIFQ